MYGSYLGAGAVGAPARVNRIQPLSSPFDGDHSTALRSATRNSRGPPELLASSVVQFQSSATRSPSKATVPSPAPTVIGTDGPGIRYASTGPESTCSSSRALRTSSTKYSATPVRSVSTVSRYGSDPSGSRPPVTWSSGHAPSRNRSLNRPALRPGSKLIPARAGSGTTTSPRVWRSRLTPLSRPGTIRTASPSNVHVPSFWMISAILRFSHRRPQGS